MHKLLVLTLDIWKIGKKQPYLLANGKLKDDTTAYIQIIPVFIC
jgi:hypothetical protein